MQTDKIKSCPCCGQTLPPEVPGAEKLSKLQREILEIVRKAGKYGISSDRLFDQIYADREDGGPLSGKKSMYVIIRYLNQKLNGFQVRAGVTGLGLIANYSLVRTRNKKLTDAEVLALRADLRPQKEIAKEYGISSCYVSHLKCGRKRKFVEQTTGG